MSPKSLLVQASEKRAAVASHSIDCSSDHYVCDKRLKNYFKKDIDLNFSLLVNNFLL